MSRQAYDPGRRYAQDDRIDRRSRGGTDDVDRPLRRDERENGSSSREGGGRQRYDDRVRQRSPKGRGTREWDSSRRGRGYEDGLFNDTDGRRSGSANGSDRRRSRSPDFAHDRARERDAYDRRHGTGPEDGAQPSPQRKTAEPDFGSSGLLVQESNSKNGVTLKYFEPPEARKPRKKWRLYIFKDGKEVDMLHVSRQSCYLLGRDQAVADIPVDHPSVSKQHAVIQYRNIIERNEYGDEKRIIKPFLIDLDSANSSFVNGKEIPPSRYYELKNGDTIKFGGSQREYVFLAEEP